MDRRKLLSIKSLCIDVAKIAEGGREILVFLLDNGYFVVNTNSMSATSDNSDHDSPKSLAMVLRVARVAVGLTQRELALLSGVSASLITKIEHGRIKRPRPQVRKALAQALQQPLELFEGCLEAEGNSDTTSLISMLVRCGVDRTAAELIINAMRARVRSKVVDLLEHEKGGGP